MTESLVSEKTTESARAWDNRGQRYCVKIEKLLERLEEEAFKNLPPKVRQQPSLPRAE